MHKTTMKFIFKQKTIFLKWIEKVDHVLTIYDKKLFLPQWSTSCKPSKPKLELKSSKTRLLPSRNGVLNEFKSGVFTCNGYAISGWKLKQKSIRIMPIISH